MLIGELQSVINLSNLQKVSKKAAKKEQASIRKGTVAQSVTDKMAGFLPILDVRGARANELLPLLQRFLDEALMLNQSSLKIIHGKGNGVLRHLVRDELKQWPQVSEYEDEHVARGGDGATVVRLK